ncbi:DUF4238 domain-containing protein [Serratia fonticola]|jgi:hypothetical protein|uniref:DUF4238 domain-containing protein n=1 Tax=Serratia fonticola TaxID=47917 RepID=A0AAE7JTL8_SERFO|nr:DUF4238 domain-containing protein [Serratia fonticola]QKJ58810.2 DUF4238 domain-containing protein [Serratia fonticola]
MSGKRQHFMPQFLQRGFSFDNGKKQQYTWQYRLDGKVLLANIKNVGTEGFFYSLDSDHSVDDTITDAESDFSELVVALQNHNIDNIASLDISKFISHLESRTRHIRISIQNSFSCLMENIGDAFFKKEIIIEYVTRNIISKPNKLEKLIDRQLESMTISSAMKYNLKQLMTNNVNFWLPTTVESMAEVYKPLIAEAIREKLPVVMKVGHLKALNESIFPEAKVNDYVKLEFNVISMNYDLPLGDNMVLFEVEGDRKFKPYYERSDVLRNIYLPISSRKLLCGSSKGCIPSINDLDLHIAECSSEYFISSIKDERSLEMQKLIGKNSYAISNDKIIELLSELIDGDSDWI